MKRTLLRAANMVRRLVFREKRDGKPRSDRL